jgi:tRNA A37 threonylcarbamoyladenosine synthetase subunit TsaC/SUA5/YrdC
MAAELLKIHPLNPEMRKINRVVDVLRKGGIVVYPTDTIYGIGCDLMNRKSIERLCRVMDIKPNKLDLVIYLQRPDPYFRVCKKSYIHLFSRF